MPVSPTFGSVGDIISLCIIIKDLCKALNRSKGASAEYQQVVTELWALDDALVQAESLWETQEISDKLKTLQIAICRSASLCRDSIERFHEKLKKYESSLQKGASKLSVQSTIRKAQWQFSESEELAKFRAEIGLRYSALTILLTKSNLEITRLNNQILNKRLDNSDHQIKDSATEHRLLLTRLYDQAEENGDRICRVNAATSSIMQRLDWFQNLSQDIKNLAQYIYLTSLATYNAVIYIRDHLERSLFLDQFVLDDPLGRTFKIPLQFIDSWDAFDAVMEVRFRGFQGHDMVLNKRYVLHEALVDRDIDRRFPWEGEFSHGQRVVMCMEFIETSESNGCPNCHLISGIAEDTEIKCAACKIWYRRKQKPLVTATAPQALGSDTPFVYRDGDSVASFKRVRMMWTRSNSVEPSNIQAGHSQDGVHASQHDNFLPLLFAMKHPRKTNEGPHSRVPSCSMTDARGRMMRKELKKHVRKEIMN